MDKEQQVRLNFLDEAQECFDRIESVLLGLGSTVAEPEQLDLALRAAHSVKGGAGMMGFMPLSHVAHRIEDFFKILRVRYHSTQIPQEVETLLLHGVDSLREVSELHRQSVEVTDSWLSDRVEPVFEQLRSHLGDLQQEDEDSLFAQNEAVDPLMVMFDEEVETILDEFEADLEKIAPTELGQKLTTTADKLLAFGHMAELAPFIQLCESIQQQAAICTGDRLAALSQQALSLWHRSHALVARGSLDKLPSQLEGFELALVPSGEPVETAWQDGEFSAIDGLLQEDNAFSIDAIPAAELLAMEREISLHLDRQEELSLLEEELVSLGGLSQKELWALDEAISSQLEQPAESVLLEDFGMSQEELSAIDEAIYLQLQQEGELANLASIPEVDFEAIASLQLAEELAADLNSIPEIDLDSEELVQLESALNKEIQLRELDNPPATVTSTPNSVPRQSAPLAGKMVRIPVEQLYQFNTLFGKLILERNRVNLRLEQLKNFSSLMRQRMNQLEESNTRLKQWYDRASLEGIVPVGGQFVPAFASNGTQSLSDSRQDRFDTLEMDRYSDLHLISQEQIETVVQLDEVTTDIELGLQEIGQSIQELTQTTRSLQANVTRTQMVPFADLARPFPRLIRDLGLQFGKEVNLKIEGESTLIDRAIVETLNAPLIHLIRNAFDHGIEEAATRTILGKSPQGNITLQAVNRGTKTIITISDDGGGIRLDKIRDRLRKMNIPDEQIGRMSEAEILNYIFQPGFSTTDRVTELSGRGVGMDVVRTNLQEIRGDIRVETQERRGTTFTITVPFTLSILRVMLLERSGMVFAVPVNSIRELSLLPAGESDRFTWQKQAIPLIQLEKSLVFNRPVNPFEMTGNPAIKQPTALVVGEGTSVGAIAIDRVWGEQEVSIQPIDTPLRLPEGFISSMVLGDGRVVPLLDPVQILQAALETDIDSADSPDEGESDLRTAPAIASHNTILVVDDSINVRRYLTLTLEKAGYRVEQAKDGQEAVDKLLGRLSVQAVICDLEMPRLDGYGVLEELKSKPEFKSLPVVMLTSRSNEKHRKLAMNLGASGYFSKPYNEQELLQKMSELIAQGAY